MRLLGRRAARGLTLLELAVAVLILSIGVIAAMRASDQARGVIGGADDRLLAGIVARNRLEELRLYGGAGPALPAEVTQAGRVFRVETRLRATAGGLIEAAVTARPAQGGAGARRLGYLPGEAAR